MKPNELYSKIPNPNRICTDTRNIKSGDVFWALKGEKFDGNKFAQNALEKGACLVIADDKQLASNKKIIVVEDSLISLQQIANYHRRKLKLPILAITGTNGKTTTKELIHKVLNKAFTTQATRGNLNNHIGVPLTLLSFDHTTEFGIIEMGANHEGEIAQLCNIAEPNYGLITNIGKAHLEGFGSFDGIIRAKTELYKYLENKQIFINHDDSLLNNYASKNRLFSYGKNKGADVRAILHQKEESVSVKILKPDEFIIKSQLAGTYNFDNILAAAAVGLFFRIPSQDIVKAVKDFQPENNRSQTISAGKSTIILDAYNANPTSTLAAIDNIFNTEKKQIVIFLGDMFELGKYAEEEHTKIINSLYIQAQQHKEKNISIFLTGNEYCKALNTHISIPPKNCKTKCFADTDSVIHAVGKQKFSEARILIKGSRGMAMEKILDSVKKATD